MNDEVKIVIYFDVETIGHKFSIYLNDGLLTITKHQEIIFQGTLSIFKKILSGDIEHNKVHVYDVINEKLHEILDKFDELLSKHEETGGK
jgi:hypothetical protein